MIKVTHEMFVAEVYNLVGSEYTVLGKYTKMKENIKMRHNICGHEYEVTPDNFKRGRRCPKCAINIAKKKKSFNIDIFKNKVFKLVKDEYTVLGNEYVNARTPIRIKHNKCGYEWDVAPYHFLNNGTRCPKCVKKRLGMQKRKNHEDFVDEVDKITNSEYEVVGKYINAITKIEMKHKTCGTVYKVEPNAFLNGNRCPECNKRKSISKGEQCILDYLEEKCINYEYQFIFNNCKNKFPLPFDFAVFDKSKKILFVIEYDGRQHYEVIDAWGGKSEFERIKKCDKIKDDYCKNNNINLIRIPYWEYENIEKILDNLFLRDDSDDLDDLF